MISVVIWRAGFTDAGSRYGLIIHMNMFPREARMFRGK
jgi:hypothetical protein